MGLLQSPPAMRARRRLANVLEHRVAPWIERTRLLDWASRHIAVAEQLGGSPRVSLEIERHPFHLELQLGMVILEVE